MENRMENNPWNDNPRRDWFRRNKWIFFVGPLAIALFIAIGGEVVMHLWNWLAPALFGWRQINFWQALGLLVLCRILFGGWGGRGHGRDRGKWRRGRDERWAQLTPEEREKFRRGREERWAKMTPEEREKFGQSLRSRRCGPFGAPTSGSNEPA
jgi:hypothetical protein